MTTGMRTVDWLLAILLGVVLVPGIATLAEVWSRVDYYSHGYMVPLVALWAASAQRAILPSLPVGHDMRGLGVLALALAGYAMGMIASIVWLTGVSAVLAVAGGVLYLRGMAWLRALSFGIGYLLFMVPVPEAILTPVIVGLQLLTSEVGVAILRLLGEPIFREGNVIVLAGGESLFVAEACSGITSLITLVPLGVFLAYFTERTPLRRLILVVTVIPVAMAGNLIRVIGTVFLARDFGTKMATESALHDWIGVSTYVLACIVLLGVGSLMKRWESVRAAEVAN